MEVGLDLALVAEEVAVEMVVGIVFWGLEGEGESSVGVFFERLVGAVAAGFQIVNGLLEQELLEADFHLL